MQDLEKIYFSSDQHFGHTTAIFDNQQKSWNKNARVQFKSVDSMNGAMIDAWNLEVPDDGEVQVLGDFVYHGNRPEQQERTLEQLPVILGQLAGKKHLIVGNHDLCFNNPDNDQAYLDAGFTSVTHGQTTIELAGKAFDLCHFPRKELKHQANWQIHGHRHSRIQANQALKTIDVGVDAWSFRPVSAQAILSTAM